MGRKDNGADTSRPGQMQPGLPVKTRNPREEGAKKDVSTQVCIRVRTPVHLLLFRLVPHVGLHGRGHHNVRAR